MYLENFVVLYAWTLLKYKVIFSDYFIKNKFNVFYELYIYKNKRRKNSYNYKQNKIKLKIIMSRYISISWLIKKLLIKILINYFIEKGI